jgi:hypothetical protein
MPCETQQSALPEAAQAMILASTFRASAIRSAQRQSQRHLDSDRLQSLLRTQDSIKAGTQHRDAVRAYVRSKAVCRLQRQVQGNP